MTRRKINPPNVVVKVSGRSYGHQHDAATVANCREAAEINMTKLFGLRETKQEFKRCGGREKTVEGKQMFCVSD